MANSFTLSSIAGLAIAGAGLGLYLGSSAVSEINPAYFKSVSSGSTFRADLAANRPSLDAEPLTLATSASPVELGGGCIGCRTYPEEYFPVQDPAVESYASSYPSFRTVPADRIMAEADAYVAQGPSREDLERVQRYAHYQIPREEASAVADVPPRQDVWQDAAENGDCGAGNGCEGAAVPAA